MKFSNIELFNHVENNRQFGIIGCRVHVGNKILEKNRHLTVVLDQESFPLDWESYVIYENNDYRSLQFHINGFVLENGSHSLQVSAGEGDELISSPVKRLEISNHGEVFEFCFEQFKDIPLIIGRDFDSNTVSHLSDEFIPGFEHNLMLDTIELSDMPSPTIEHSHAHLEKYGFCVLPSKINDEIIDAFKRELDDAIKSGDIDYKPGSSRITHAHQKLPSARKIWLDETVNSFLKQHFKDSPVACQTLTFTGGSEQSAHQDTIHLTSYSAGFMCGVWIALEDVQENSGELFVYPKSHKATRLKRQELDIPIVENNDYSAFGIFDKAVKDLIQSNQFEKLVYRPKKGTILVWQENLIHGGSKRDSVSKSRLSIVSHYYARGCASYYDSRGTAAKVTEITSM